MIREIPRTDFTEEDIPDWVLPIIEQLCVYEKHKDNPPLRQSYHMKGKLFPRSCTIEEGLLLSSVIEKNGLVSGVELGTGFGFSALFLGKAFEKTGGKVTTIDNYDEERANSDQYLINALSLRAKTAIFIHGWNFLHQCLKQLDLNSVEIRVGIFQSVVKKLHRKFDFAFIDGCHYDDEPMNDLFTVIPYLRTKYCIAFHDTHSPFVRAAYEKAVEHLKADAALYRTTHGLALVYKGIRI